MGDLGEDQLAERPRTFVVKSQTSQIHSFCECHLQAGEGKAVQLLTSTRLWHACSFRRSHQKVCTPAFALELSRRLPC